MQAIRDRLRDAPMVNASNAVVGTFTADSQNPADIVLLNKQGKVIWHAGSLRMSPAAATMPPN